MDKIRESFHKVKGDISHLYSELSSMKSEFSEIKSEMIRLCEILGQLNSKIDERSSLDNQTTPTHPSTHNLSNSTTPTHPSTHNYPLEGLESQNLAISIRNEGVPTDRQTDRQTDNQQSNTRESPFDKDSSYSPQPIDDAAKILDSLDSLKKEIRLKFKMLTEQELLVFSTLYQLEEERGFTDYRTLAAKIGLTESSIRDYIGRLLKKGIPVDKKRINNKTIALSISENLKKVASLPTILSLRDL